ncbi:MAG: hypothetical protein QOJ89_861 [bacterium]
MNTRLAAIAQGAARLPPDALVDRARLVEARRLEARLRRSPAVRGAALVLHAVAADAGDPGLELDPPLAADRLDALAGYVADRYVAVSAGELTRAARERRPGQRVPVALTFDDDLSSHAALAAPILSRHGIVATAFLCGTRRPFWWQLLQIAVDRRAVEAAALPALPAALVDAALKRRRGAIGKLGREIERLSPAQRDDLRTRLEQTVQAPPPLSAEGRAQLAAAGWEIGFHTLRHDVLTELDDVELRSALERGRDGVGATAVRTLAYPHGKAGQREAAAARRAGYVAAYTGRAEVLTERTSPQLIGRLQPESATLGRFALQLARALSAP